ncbi:hypothetical protein DI273_24025 [Streptomyces violascens]|nr:hypothetical protein DI273_24025 [Streptomyces violascens]
MHNLAGLKNGDDVPLIEREGRAHARLLKDKLQELAGEAQDWWERAVEAHGAYNGTSIDEEDSTEAEDDQQEAA